MTFIHAALFAIFFVAVLVMLFSIIRLMFMRSGRRSVWGMSVGFELFNAANYKPEAARTRRVMGWSVVAAFASLLTLMLLAAVGAKPA